MPFEEAHSPAKWPIQFKSVFEDIQWHKFPLFRSANNLFAFSQILIKNIFIFSKWILGESESHKN
jgi:hypothetical protein